MEGGARVSKERGDRRGESDGGTMWVEEESLLVHVTVLIQHLRACLLSSQRQENEEPHDHSRTIRRLLNAPPQLLVFSCVMTVSSSYRHIISSPSVTVLTGSH